MTRVEWMYAPAVSGELLAPGDEAADGQTDDDYALEVGGDSCVCFTGTVAQIEDMLQGLLATVRGED